MSRGTVQIQLPREAYRVLRELSVLEGRELGEFVVEVADAYVRAKYGIEEFERMTVADLLRSIRAIAVVATYVRDIFVSLASIAHPAALGAPQARETEETGGRESALRELADRVEMLSKSVLELREEVALMRAEGARAGAEERAGGGAALPPALAEMEEIKQEVVAMMANAMRQMVRKLVTGMVGSQRPAAAALAHAAAAA